MKKLILLSFAIISSNAFSYSNLEEQLCAAVNNCDVKKTQGLINKIGEVNAELKLTLIKSAQSNIEYYQNGSKLLFLSPRDSVNFGISAAILAGSFKIIDFCRHNGSGKKILEKFLECFEAACKYFNLKRHETPNFKKFKDDFDKQINPICQMQTGLCVSAISIAFVASLMSVYKIVKATSCSSASNKLNQAQAVYSLVSEIKVKERA